MTAQPVTGTVLCSRIDRKAGPFEPEPLAEYVVESVADGVEWPSVGDVVVCNSTGTAVHLPDGVKYLFKVENIAGRIRDER